MHRRSISWRRCPLAVSRVGAALHRRRPGGPVPAGTSTTLTVVRLNAAKSRCRRPRRAPRPAYHPDLRSCSCDSRRSSGTLSSCSRAPGNGGDHLLRHGCPRFRTIHRDRDIVLSTSGAREIEPLNCDSGDETGSRASEADIDADTRRCLKVLGARRMWRIYTSVAVDILIECARCWLERINFYACRTHTCCPTLPAPFSATHLAVWCWMDSCRRSCRSVRPRALDAESA